MEEKNLTGEIIKNRYCILERIGSGGNGRIYLALDMELGCKWAVKVIDHQQKKEAVILKELNHPFLPKMVDYEETDTHCYLMMEYIEGENLEDYLRSGKRFAREEIWEILIMIAQILAYFHQQKPPIFYGDMKPANLIRTSTGQIYLVDFGSVVSGYREMPQICQGTRGYAAPEQYRGRITAASDVYGFGRTVQRLVGSKWKVWGYSAVLSWIIFRCCRKLEKHRYKNMEIVLGHLQRTKVSEEGTGRILLAFFMTLVLLIGLIIGSWEMSRNSIENEMDFKTELTKVTNYYWEDETFQNTGELSGSCCEKVEQELKSMFQTFSKVEEQREILVMLAVNAEYMEEYRNAAFYYEQLLVYDQEYVEAYGLYGMFLMRIGQEEESIRLHEQYKMVQKKNVEKNDSYILEIWNKNVEEKKTYGSWEKKGEKYNKEQEKT